MGAKPEHLIVFAKGKKGRVCITRSCRKQLDDASDHVEADFLALARRAVDFGFEELNEGQFKFEGRISSSKPGGASIAIHAFKPFRFRIYGVLTKDGKCGDFIGYVGVVKKRDKADRDDLVRAARKSEE